MKKASQPVASEIAKSARDLESRTPRVTFPVENCEALHRLGELIEDTAGGRTDVCDLGIAMRDLAGALALGRIPPRAGAGKSIGQLLRSLIDKPPDRWTARAVAGRVSALRACLRAASPRVGLASREILVIDDDPIVQKTIGAALRRAGFSPVSCLKGREAVRQLKTRQPALILFDAEMPEIRGPQLLRAIRSDGRLAATPVIFLSTDKRLDVALDALCSGADDYLTKPLRPEELAIRVSARLERGALLQEIAVRDPLTGAATHRLFHERLEEELSRFSRYKVPFAVALLDVDDLARVNATAGYGAGDRMVLLTGQVLRRGMRSADLVARTSGGEFGIVMPHTNAKGAMTILDRLRKRLERGGGRTDSPPVSLSGGVACCPETTIDRRRLLAAAREALETAKRRGKGCLVLADVSRGDGSTSERVPPPASPLPPPSSQPPTSVLDGLTALEIRTLRDVFVQDMSEHLRRLDGLDPGLPIRERARAIGRTGHFLAGSGAAGGRPELSELGAVIEASIDALLDAGTPPAGAEIVIREIHDVLQRLAAGLRADNYDPSDAGNLEQRLRTGLPANKPDLDSGSAEQPTRADVLVIDDEKISQVAIGGSLSRAGFSIREAYSGAEALEAVVVKVPDLIILDVALPDTDGHEVLVKIRQNPKLQLVPVIFVTAKRQLDDKIQALRTGADDYVTKPFSPEELVARVGSQLERAQISRDLALRDGLTGLYNHRFFQERIDQEILRAKRYRKSFCLALLDIDNFKSVNDSFGHQTGDAVLRAMAGKLSAMFRSTDIIARYGGEEFAIILPETPLPAAAESLERVRAAVVAELIVQATTSGNVVRATFSAGIGEVAGESKTDFVSRVDAALYKSKRTGKNRITIAHEPIATDGNAAH